MASAAACWTVKRYVVEIVVLEVLFVLCIAARLLVRPGGSVVGEPRNETSGSSFRSHSRSNQLRTPSLAIASAAHNLSSQSTSFDIQSLVESVAPRAFPLWNNLTVALPCPPAEEGWTSSRVQHATTRTGLLYVKVPKTGSSTASSVNLRLASRIYQKRAEAAESSESVGNRSQSSSSPQEVCRSRSMHSPAHRIQYGRRDRMQSVLWSVVRDPTSRAVSQYFHFYVSRFGHNASDDSAFRRFLWENRESLPSVQVRYLAFDEVAHLENGTADDPIEVRRSLRLPNRWRRRSPPKAPSPLPAVSVESIRSILRGYDFVGVSERMDESLVALQMLLGLETSDVLHMRYAQNNGVRVAAGPVRNLSLFDCRKQCRSSKVSGGYDDGLYRDRCVYIQPSFRTLAMQELLEGPVWRRWSKWDVVLHRAANRSLDLTIESLGPARFYGQLEAFRSMQRGVADACSRRVVLPCDASRHGLGRRPVTDCVLGDSGCGFDCIDRYLAMSAASGEAPLVRRLAGVVSR